MVHTCNSRTMFDKHEGPFIKDVMYKYEKMIQK